MALPDNPPSGQAPSSTKVVVGFLRVSSALREAAIFKQGRRASRHMRPAKTGAPSLGCGKM